MKMNKDQFFSALTAGKVKNFKINGVKYYSKILERDFYVDKAYLKSLGKAEKNLITSIIGILKSDVDSLLKYKNTFLNLVTEKDSELFNQSTNKDEFDKLSNKFIGFLNSFNVNDYLCSIGSPYGESGLSIRFSNKSDKNFARIKFFIDMSNWTINSISIYIALPEDNNKYYSVNIYSNAHINGSIKKSLFNIVKNYLGTKIVEEN